MKRFKFKNIIFAIFIGCSSSAYEQTNKFPNTIKNPLNSAPTTAHYKPVLLAAANDLVRGPNKPVNPSNPFDDTKVFYNTPSVSDYVSIIGQNDALITIWALAPLNWVWGYSPLNSRSFGDARIWRFIIYPKNFVQIQNKKTGTCINTYQNGIVHIPCEDTNQAQFWELKPFSNGTVLIKNFASQTCLQSNSTKGYSYYGLYLVDCAEKAINLDQQWQIIAPAMTTSPIPLPSR